jgi:hypothetical protein
MQPVLAFLSAQPLVFVFTLIFLGTALGRVTVRGVGLGPAAVLFAALPSRRSRTRRARPSRCRPSSARSG